MKNQSTEQLWGSYASVVLRVKLSSKICSNCERLFYKNTGRIVSLGLELELQCYNYTKMCNTRAKKYVLKYLGLLKKYRNWRKNFILVFELMLVYPLNFFPIFPLVIYQYHCSITIILKNALKSICEIGTILSKIAISGRIYWEIAKKTSYPVYCRLVWNYSTLTSPE